MKEEFSQRCREKIGSYVYALLDPRISGSRLSQIFYIGKGTRNRCYRHAHIELRAEELADRQIKLATIRAIRKEGFASPQICIVAHGLSDDEAHRIEAILIGILGNRSLTNKIKGKGDSEYWLAANELDARHAKPILRSKIPGTLLLVSLNGGRKLPSYKLIMDDAAEVERRTLGAWPIAEKKAQTVDYVVGVYRGLTRCAFAVTKDESKRSVFSIHPPLKKRAKSRVRFQGTLVADCKWLLRRIVDDTGKPLTDFGPQSACRLI